jgi:hypothetical protein
MNVKINGRLVDVVDKVCAVRSCFVLGQDKGAFVQGRGYVRYNDKPEWVCFRRHIYGCPCPLVCPACNAAHAELSASCRTCGGPLKLLAKPSPAGELSSSHSKPKPKETNEDPPTVRGFPGA